MSNPKVPNRIYTKEKIQEIKKKLIDYIEDNTIPIIAEFAYHNHIPRQTLYELMDIKEIMNELICKKEANLEKGMLSGKLPVAAASFSLKQLGWRDRQEIESTGGITINVTHKNKDES